MSGYARCVERCGMQRVEPNLLEIECSEWVVVFAVEPIEFP